MESEGIEKTVEKINALVGPVSRRRAHRFYDRLRSRIAAWAASGQLPPAIAEILLFVPDFFILLWRLARDSRVGVRNRMLLGTAVAYFIFPLDFIPEMLAGPVGFLDDLVLAVFVLNKLLRTTDEDIVREHWSGDHDVLDVMRKILAVADSAVSTNLIRKLRKFVQ